MASTEAGSSDINSDVSSDSDSDVDGVPPWVRREEDEASKELVLPRTVNVLDITVSSVKTAAVKRLKGKGFPYTQCTGVPAGTKEPPTTNGCQVPCQKLRQYPLTLYTRTYMQTRCKR